MKKFARNLISTPIIATNRYSESANKVFYQPLLREMILAYAIQEKEVDVATLTIQSCRLVNKAWLQSISKVLLKSQTPLFMFEFDFNFDTGEDERNIIHFVSSVTGGSSLEDRVPPHSISITLRDSDSKRFRPDDQLVLKTVFDCFVHCGSGLVELNLVINYNYHSRLLNTEISFPKLGYFDVFIEGFSQRKPKILDDKMAFIQRVVSSTEQLKSFFFTYERWGLSPVSLRDLALPPSITEIDLNCLPTHCPLGMLAMNPLPNLRKLTFRVAGSPFQTDGLVESILKNVRKSLIELSIVFLDDPSETLLKSYKCPTAFQLPFMEKLQCLEVDTPFLELQGIRPSSLQQLVPVLNQMTLGKQTISMFQKWVDKSCFRSVTSLTVSVCTHSRRGIFPIDLDEVNFDATTMRAVQNAFPNVRKLEITFPVLEPSDPVIAILWEMKNLKSLHIRIGEMSPNNQPLDASFIGIPVDDVPKLKKSPALWEGMQAKNSLSIRNLADLRTLKLARHGWGRIDRISDLMFDFAFFKMPKLTNLTLEGFAPSAKSTKTWTEEGRTITIGKI